MSKDLDLTYLVSKEIFNKLRTPKEGVEFLINNTNFNASSIRIMTLNVLPKLFEGEKFTRTLNVNHFEYFISKIHEDLGQAGLLQALNAMEMHIEYCKGNKDPKKEMQRRLEKFYGFLEFNTVKENCYTQDEKEQEEILSYLLKNETKNNIANELKNYKPSEEPETVFINQRLYKRDNKVIAQIKFIRNFSCQICGYSVPKYGGGKYIEAAHITPKHQKGSESPENIILLCPNHHKEFDFGNPLILSRDHNHVKFQLNGNEHHINLFLE